MFFVTYREQNRDVVQVGVGWRRGKTGGTPPPPSDGERQSEQATTEEEGGGEGWNHEVLTGCGDAWLQGSLDLAGMGKTAGLLLGEDQLVADGDLEDATGPFDELGLDTEPGLDLLRQTGGAGEVVSDAAVLDDDTLGHGRAPFEP